MRPTTLHSSLSNTYRPNWNVLSPSSARLSLLSLSIGTPDGEKFATYVELATSREQEKLAKEQAQQELEQSQQELEQSQQELEQSQQELEQEKVRSQQLAAKLRELGIDPN